MDKFTRRCCYNCRHHRGYNMVTDMLTCSLKAGKLFHNAKGEAYWGVDYSQKMKADSPPCKDWEVDTNVPDGFTWRFENPRQLTLDLKI